jgi:hypothetical protein
MILIILHHDVNKSHQTFIIINYINITSFNLNVFNIHANFRMRGGRFGPSSLFACSFYHLIQVDIGGHPPLPTGSKQFSGNFGNLLFLAVFNFQGHFEGLNEGFSGSSFSMIA